MVLALVTLANEKCYPGQKQISISAIEHGASHVFNWSWNEFQKTSWYKMNDIFKEHRGLGYWSWKPFIIRDALMKLNDGDTVLYHDAGRQCYGWKITESLIPAVEYLNKHHNGFGIIFGGFNHGKFSKRDCFVHMACNEKKFHEHRQVSATWSFWQKNSFCLRILDEWILWLMHPSKIVSDKPSISENLPDYDSSHRHDQSILTNILLKKHFSKEYKIIFARRYYEKDINNFLRMHKENFKNLFVKDP
jgi:hypothetical protein